MTSKWMLERASEWMMANKGILPGPLSESDWEQIANLLATYEEYTIMDKVRDEAIND